MFSMYSTEMPAALLFFLFTGVAVGFGHCIGMCGPIVVALSLKSAERRRMLPHLFYHAGRIITYTVLGGIVGASGSFTSLAAQVMAHLGSHHLHPAHLKPAGISLFQGAAHPVGQSLQFEPCFFRAYEKFIALTAKGLHSGILHAQWSQGFLYGRCIGGLVEPDLNQDAARKVDALVKASVHEQGRHGHQEQ